MTWESALATSTRLIEAQKLRAKATTETDANTIIGDAGKLVSTESPQITALLRQQGLDALANRLTVAFEIFARFAERPPRNEIRLVNLIDDHLRLLMIELREIVARSGAGQQSAIDTLPPSANAAALFALAVTDARLRFKLPEKIENVIAAMTADATRIKDVLRVRSDSRFDIATRGPAGEVELGFTFNGIFESVVAIGSGAITDAAIRRTRDAMAAAQAREFLRVPGVAQLNELLESLKTVAPLAEIVETEGVQPLLPPLLPIGGPVANA